MLIREESMSDVKAMCEEWGNKVDLSAFRERYAP